MNDEDTKTAPEAEGTAPANPPAENPETPAENTAAPVQAPVSAPVSAPVPASAAGSGAHVSNMAPVSAVNAADPLAVGFALEAIARGERTISH